MEFQFIEGARHIDIELGKYDIHNIEKGLFFNI